MIRNGIIVFIVSIVSIFGATAAHAERPANPSKNTTNVDVDGKIVVVIPEREERSEKRHHHHDRDDDACPSPAPVLKPVASKGIEVPQGEFLHMRYATRDGFGKPRVEPVKEILPDTPSDYSKSAFLAVNIDQEFHTPQGYGPIIMGAMILRDPNKVGADLLPCSVLVYVNKDGRKYRGANDAPQDVPFILVNGKVIDFQWERLTVQIGLDEDGSPITGEVWGIIVKS